MTYCPKCGAAHLSTHVHRCKTSDVFERINDLEEALQKIVQWSEAYPNDIFPEPDWERARKLLEAGGITMDAVSAHCMRHVIEGVGKIARSALSPADRGTS